METDRVFIVIPAHNEALVIGDVIKKLLERYRNIIVVDDCSTDQTDQIAKNYPIYCLRHVVNLGQGAALQTGDELALALGADVIVHFDADGQHRVDQIEKLTEPIRAGRADIVFGSRFLGVTSALPRLKRWILLPLGRLVNWFFTGLRLSDAHNGFRAMSREAADRINIRLNRMAHATEIVSQVREHRLRYQEVPVVIDYREFGQGLTGGLRIIRDLILKAILK